MSQFLKSNDHIFSYLARRDHRMKKYNSIYQQNIRIAFTAKWYLRVPNTNPVLEI